MGDVHGEICLAWAWCWVVLVLVMRGEVNGGVIGDWVGFVRRVMRHSCPMCSNIWAEAAYSLSVVAF